MTVDVPVVDFERLWCPKYKRQERASLRQRKTRRSSLPRIRVLWRDGVMKREYTLASPMRQAVDGEFQQLLVRISRRRWGTDRAYANLATHAHRTRIAAQMAGSQHRADIRAQAAKSSS